MQTKFEEGKFIHKPNTKEIFFSLSSMPQWCEILLRSTTNKYSAFLKWVLDKNFLKAEKDFSIKNLAKWFGADSVKITKWISQIYADVFELNEEQPVLFRTNGIRHDLHFRNYDSYGFVTIWMLATPRMHERFSFYFMNAKVGCSYFYVDDVEHIIGESEHSICITLAGGFVNRYREFLVDRAEFEGVIGFAETLNPFEFGLNEKLRKWYR
jgi:hypothetical protein